MEGGLWDEASNIYPLIGAKGREMQLDWTFPSGARITFDSLQHEKDKFAFQGAQICGLGLDELTHFTESQFFYLLSRNRSACGVRPYVRATTNPDANSWVKRFLEPWLVVDHPFFAKSGEIRHFIRDGGVISWSFEPKQDSKSLTFIRATLYGNQKLLERDPGYVANLKSLSLVDRARLLDGSWDVVEGGNLFRAEWFGFCEVSAIHAAGPTNRVRFWDLAGTEAVGGNDPDYSVGVLMARDEDGILTIEDVQRVRERPLGVEKLIAWVAQRDGSLVPIRMEQEPGSSGVAVIDRYRRVVLAGFDFAGIRSTGDKTERAKPLSAQAENGHVKLVRGNWNTDFLNELAQFPTKGAHDDQVDAASGAFRELVKKRAVDLAFS